MRLRKAMAWRSCKRAIRSCSLVWLARRIEVFDVDLRLTRKTNCYQAVAGGSVDRYRKGGQNPGVRQHDSQYKIDKRRHSYNRHTESGRNGRCAANRAK